MCHINEYVTEQYVGTLYSTLSCTAGSLCTSHLYGAGAYKSGRTAGRKKHWRKDVAGYLRIPVLPFPFQDLISWSELGTFFGCFTKPSAILCSTVV